MATVTGITYAKAMEILNGTISGASINGSGHLIFTKVGGGTPIDAGYVLGPTGPAGPPGSPTMAEVKTDTGRGLIQYARVSTEQEWDSAGDNFVTITGSSVIFTPVADEYYQFVAGCVAKTDDDDGSTFDLHVVKNDDDDIYLRASNHTHSAGRGVGINGSRVFKAGSDWTGAKTFHLEIRASVTTAGADRCYVQGNYVSTFLAVIGLGDG